MFLHEEYLSRNKVGLPFIVYGKNSSLILRNPSLPSRWRIFNVSFDGGYSTGSYFVTYFGLRHNGYKNKRYLDVLFKSKRIYYDQLEKCLLSVNSVLDFDGFRPILNFDEATLFLWESFIYTHDVWIAEEQGKDFLNLVADTIDFRKSKKDRVLLTRKAWSVLLNYSAETLNCYDNKFNRFVSDAIDNKSNWLISLICDDRHQ